MEALLEEARLTARMPEPAERLRLRQAASLSRAQVAAAVGVGRQTVANWEDGTTDPQPPGRVKYLRLLEGLAQLHPAPAVPAETTVTEATTAATFTAPETARGPNGLAIEGEPGPCIRCGVTTTYRSTDGRPLHAGAMCQPPPPHPRPPAPMHRPPLPHSPRHRPLRPHPSRRRSPPGRSAGHGRQPAPRPRPAASSARPSTQSWSAPKATPMPRCRP